MPLMMNLPLSHVRVRAAETGQRSIQLGSLAQNLEENYMQVREGLEDLIDVLLTQAGTRSL